MTAEEAVYLALPAGFLIGLIVVYAAICAFAWLTGRTLR